MQVEESDHVAFEEGCMDWVGWYVSSALMVSCVAFVVVFFVWRSKSLSGSVSDERGCWVLQQNRKG